MAEKFRAPTDLSLQVFRLKITGRLADLFERLLVIGGVHILNLNLWIEDLWRWLVGHEAVWYS